MPLPVSCLGDSKRTRFRGFWGLLLSFSGDARPDVVTFFAVDDSGSSQIWSPEKGRSTSPLMFLFRLACRRCSENFPERPMLPYDLFLRLEEDSPVWLCSREGRPPGALPSLSVELPENDLVPPTLAVRACA